MLVEQALLEPLVVESNADGQGEFSSSSSFSILISIVSVRELVGCGVIVRMNAIVNSHHSLLKFKWGQSG